jgi:hypothetical protein
MASKKKKRGIAENAATFTSFTHPYITNGFNRFHRDLYHDILSIICSNQGEKQPKSLQKQEDHRKSGNIYYPCTFSTDHRTLRRKKTLFSGSRHQKYKRLQQDYIYIYITEADLKGSTCLIRSYKQ